MFSGEIFLSCAMNECLFGSPRHPSSVSTAHFVTAGVRVTHRPNFGPV
jgi:hypothetical protein